ncbi:MAG TPA: FkbM family methyltransferase [Vicinamibacterales bacterium]|jgi:FkbM family methyltransferase
MKHLVRDIFIDPRFDADYGRHPLVLADVGARGGLKRNWAAAERHLRVIGFEPDEREYRRLAERADPSRTFVHAALHDRRGPLPLYLARDRGLSSIFRPNRPFVDAFPDADRFDTTEVVEIQADTLDNLLGARDITDLDFIKADTQGSELFVLRGAERTLTTTAVGVEVEVEFAPVYVGQPLFADVDGFLRDLGYHLFDLRPCRWKRAVGRDAGGPYGQVIWADALYLKSTATLEMMAGSLPADLSRSKILRAISVALLYGYADYALAIASGTTALQTNERDLVVAALRARNPAHIGPAFPGRRRLAAMSRAVWRMLRRSNEGWSVSDSGIGNLD